MKAQLPQPFAQEDIRKDPKAVIIALLIGLLMLTCGAIVYLYISKEKDQQKLYGMIIEERNQRISTYEKMLFYRAQAEVLLNRDSITKEKTKPLVEKILK